MRIGVLGLGFMGSTHLKALETLDGVEIAAVYSSDPRKLAGDLSGIAGNLGGPGKHFDFGSAARYGEIEPLLADPSIDAIDICLPTALHADVAIQALRAGKHVLVEKPIALDGRSARAMLAAAWEHGRILMTAQVLRFMPMYRALGDRLRAGDLGPVRWAVFCRRCAAPGWSKWLGNPSQSGGGVFDLLIHDVDMCLHLFGLPDSVSATGYEALDRGIDLLMAELHYPDGKTAYVTGGWHHPKAFPFSMDYTVVTDEATIDYSSSGRVPTLYFQSGEEQALPLAEHDGYAAEIAYFVECCRSGQQPAACAPEESAAAVELTRLLLDSRTRNGEKLTCRR